MVNENHPLSRDQLVKALVLRDTYTTDDGAVGGTSLIDTYLIGSNDFITGKMVVISSGLANKETKVATSFNPTTGEVFFLAMSHQILHGINYKIVTIGVSNGDAQQSTLNAVKSQTDLLPADPASQSVVLGAIATRATQSDILTDATPFAGADIGLIKSQTDKLAGDPPVTGTANQAWFTGEADVVSIGAAGVKNKINDLSISIANLIGTIIRVRMYKLIAGIPTKFYDENFDATTDPPGLDLITGIVAIHDVLRVTLQSNNAADNSQHVDYDYMLEAQ
jgi:hypothetical protein